MQQDMASTRKDPSPRASSSKQPSCHLIYLWAAFGSIAGSLVFKMTGKDHHALFVGQWAPTFLILGLYNKLVKLQGSENA